jgi:hypothetical protein
MRSEYERFKLMTAASPFRAAPLLSFYRFCFLSYLSCFHFVELRTGVVGARVELLSSY